MKRWLWRPVNLAIRVIDAIYRKACGLQPVGPLLYVQQIRYKGPQRVLSDGTQLRPGASVGVLHLNNRGLEKAQSRGGHHGFVFARLMLQALASLAKAVRQDSGLSAVTGFHGVTWIPPHGRRVGFEARPLPLSWRTRVLGLYFRLLLFAFNPNSLQQTDRRNNRENNPHPGRRLEVYEFWLSREQLLDKFDQ